MIEVCGVSKNFGRLQVLHDVSLQLHSGRVVALLGPNASGKTTLLKCLLGLVNPSGGHFIFEGKVLKRGEVMYRQRIGYMPQIGRYPDNMTVGSLLTMMEDLRKQTRCTQGEELMEQFGLNELLHRNLVTLSGGTRQKVGAVLAFLFNPAVLILDEPTAGLDPLAAEVLRNAIKAERSAGKLIIVTSHVLSELDDLVDEMVYLYEGRIRLSKTMEQVRSETGEQRLSRAIATYMKQITR